MAANPSRPLTRVTRDIFKKIDDYMDNTTNAVKNKKAVLEQLVATNAKQASAISTKSNTIRALSD